MEGIKTYIKRNIGNIELQEGLLDRVKNKDVNHEELVKEFLEENYNITGEYTIDTTKIPYVVNLSGYARLKNNAKQLVNDFFVFGEVTGTFSCNRNIYIKSLKGAPEKVGIDFYCSECKSLKTLEGAPKEVGDSFDCCGCNDLIDLKGAPEKVGRNFKCASCESLKTLEGAPKKVGNMFSCKSCPKLETLKGSATVFAVSFSAWAWFMPSATSRAIS